MVPRFVRPNVREMHGYAPGEQPGPGERIVKLNTDENQQTAVQYQVLAIPTMILFRNGQEAARVQGAMPKNRIVQQLEPALAA